MMHLPPFPLLLDASLREYALPCIEANYNINRCSPVLKIFHSEVGPSKIILYVGTLCLLSIPVSMFSLYTYLSQTELHFWELPLPILLE
uniref:Uncharacterized protein n=1 Tax=Lepeophtheirus salmonis TaxID=72036 RepID=A0A0K2TR44_LEPSM